MEDNIDIRLAYIRWIGHGGKIVCPGCGQTILRLYRLEHMSLHVKPETKALIGRVTPLLNDDFYAFCIVNDFNIDGMGPRHLTVVEALACWIRHRKE